MRRIQATLCTNKAYVTIKVRDHRLIRTLIKELETRRQTRWIGAGVSRALDAFNAPEPHYD